MWNPEAFESVKHHLREYERFFRAKRKGGEVKKSDGDEGKGGREGC